MRRVILIMHVGRSLARALCAAAVLLGVSLAQAPGSGNPFEANADIGAVVKSGLTQYDPVTKEFRMTGAGGNIWGTEDAFQFTWKRISGDFTLSAEIRFIGTSAQADRKVVLMARQDLMTGSKYADATVHGRGLTSLQWRPSADGQTLEQQLSKDAPARIGLRRSGNTFTVLVGKPGEALTTVGTPQVVELTDPVYVGIGICSHDSNTLETAVVSKVTLEQVPGARR